LPLVAGSGHDFDAPKDACVLWLRTHAVTGAELAFYARAITNASLDPRLPRDLLLATSRSAALVPDRAPARAISISRCSCSRPSSMG